MTDATDAQLIAAAREGNPEAYGDLVARYQGHVYGLAYSLVNNWADAQDIAQETFVRAYVNLHQLKDPERFAPWLRRVTFSVAMNWIKAFRPSYFAKLDGRVDLEKLEVPEFTPGPQEVVERKELAEAVQRAVQSLPPRYRVPLTMFHLDGLSYDKVASFLDIPLGTAKSLIHRARAKLKDALGSYFAEELTPLVQEVFTAHKLTPQFAQKVLKALEIYQQVEEETKRYHQPRDVIIAPLVCMRAAGWAGVDYETLAVLSGAGASFAYHPQHYWVMYQDVFLPPNDPQELTARTTGFGWERLPKVSSAEEAWEIVKKTLDRGSPIVGHFYDQLVFVGYEDAAEKAQRKVCVGGGFDALGWWDWARFEEWATQWGHFGRYSGKVPRLAPERAAIEVMRGVLQCVENDPRKAKNPDAKFGWEGMEAYAADVADLSKSVDYWNPGWVGCHCIYRQMTNRKCLAIYLRRMAGKFSAKVSEAMLAAAQKYEDAYAAWLEWERHLGKDVRPDAWGVPENRLSGAAAVRKAIEHEKAAAEEIGKALAALEL